MKISKALMTVALGASITLGSQMMSMNSAAAEDVWAYSYKDGSEIYVMTETIRYEKYRGYHVTIKNLDCACGNHKIKFFFAMDEGGWWFKDETHKSQGSLHKVSDYPMLEAVIDVVLQYAK